MSKLGHVLNWGPSSLLVTVIGSDYLRYLHSDVLDII